MSVSRKLGLLKLVNQGSFLGIFAGALLFGCSRAADKAPSSSASSGALRAQASLSPTTAGPAAPALDEQTADYAYGAPMEAAPSPPIAPRAEAAKPSPSSGRLASGAIGSGAALAAKQPARSYKLAPPPPGKPLAPVPPAPMPTVARDAEFNTEAYAHVTENPFLAVANQPLSTFSIDVDTASYSNARRFLSQGQLPPADAIRVEEWLNYFHYDYPQPTGEAPFSVNAELSSCPWNDAHRLVRIGIHGRDIAERDVPPRNLVFLLDVSGSMMSEEKLPLMKRGLAMLADSLRPQDSIAITVYAGNSGLVLPPTSDRLQILKSLDSLEAGGSTNGGAGIQLAYSIAQQQFKKNGINRVILATDGDFNVGTTSEGELQRLIEEKRKSGVFLTVLGFGTGNVKDSTMELLADKGNGNYAYIDSLQEARKVLVREAGSTLVTIAKDVKLQVEFNPRRVASYKLIGYENRLLAKEDFNDDKKDAGEIGAGHNVTALYEIVPVGAPAPALPNVDALKYQAPSAPNAAAASNDLMTVSIRYKQPSSDTSTKFAVVVPDAVKPLAQTSADYRFGVAVANVALLLRGSHDVKQSSLDSARQLAAGALGSDIHGDRKEFLAMVERAERLRGPHLAAP